MNRKMKLRYRAVLSLMLSAVLFCMPVLAFSMNGDNAIDARAEETVEDEEEYENEEEEPEDGSDDDFFEDKEDE